jgi:hypothetical protein
MTEELIKHRVGAAPGERRGGRGKRSASRAKDLAESMGVDPLRWLLGLLKTGTYQAVVIDETTGKKTKKTTTASADLLVDAAKCTLQYLYPKLSGISHTGPDGEGPIEVASISIQAIINDPVLCADVQRISLALADLQAGPQQLPPAPIPGLSDPEAQ